MLTDRIDTLTELRVASEASVNCNLLSRGEAS